MHRTTIALLRTKQQGIAAGSAAALRVDRTNSVIPRNYEAYGHTDPQIISNPYWREGFSEGFATTLSERSGVREV